MGNFAPVVGECEIGDLEVEGTIPASVRGVYLRNGPNPAREPLLGAARYHWFDGDGMLHWIRLGDDDELRRRSGRKKEVSFVSFVSFRRRSYGRAYVRTKNFEREASLGESLYTGLRDITPVWRVLLPRLFTKVFEDWKSPDSPFWVVQSKNTANNGVKAHAGVLLATYESGSAYELELSRRLTTLGVCDFKKSFATKDYWLDNMTAHAKTCPKTGELVYMGYNLISLDFDAPRDEKTTDVVVGVVDKHGARTSRRVIKMSRPSMQHDVGITRSRVVLLDGPLVFDLERVLTGGLPFAFETDQSMRIGILPRAAARVGENDEENKNKEDVVWVDTGEPCFAYHVVNCYDDPADPDVVVVDVCKSDGTNALGMARGFDDDADGQGWMPAGSFVDGNETKPKTKTKTATSATTRRAWWTRTRSRRW
jgi:carotenoid cleavage dioxygenase